MHPRAHAPQPEEPLPSEAVQKRPLAGTRKSPSAAMKTQNSQTQLKKKTKKPLKKMPSLP